MHPSTLLTLIRVVNILVQGLFSLSGFQSIHRARCTAHRLCSALPGRANSPVMSCWGGGKTEVLGVGGRPDSFGELGRGGGGSLPWAGWGWKGRLSKGLGLAEATLDPNCGQPQPKSVLHT